MFSPREVQVIALAHHDRRTIGEQLGVSPNTVSNHLRSIYRKTGIHSRQELALHGMRLLNQASQSGRAEGPTFIPLST